MGFGSGWLAWAGVDLALEVGGEVVSVLALQVWALPVAAADRATARARPTLAPHRLVVVVEERIVGGQFLTSADVAHRDQDNVAGEAHAGLAGVVEEEHHRLILGLLQRG